MVDSRFSSPCSHGRGEGKGYGEEPKTMVQMVHEQHKRKPRTEDWNDDCEICCGRKVRVHAHEISRTTLHTHISHVQDEGVAEEQGNVFMCTHCNIVAHKICIERTHGDLPHGKDDEWTCMTCARDLAARSHNSECNECKQPKPLCKPKPKPKPISFLAHAEGSESEYLIADLKQAVELVHFYEAKFLEDNPTASNTASTTTAANTTSTSTAAASPSNTTTRMATNQKRPRRQATTKKKARTATTKKQAVAEPNTSRPKKKARTATTTTTDATATPPVPAAPEPPHSNIRPASRYEILRSRLQAIEANQEAYHSHLIRDSNQGEFKNVELDSLDVYSFYALMDYWAKLPSQKSTTATCEGNQIGISAHGMMFIHKNPTKAERDAIDRKFGKIIWERFGPASDEVGGKATLEEHINMVCDDAKQNVFHTKSGTYTQHLMRTRTHALTHARTHTHTYIHIYMNQSRRQRSTCSWSRARGYAALVAHQRCSRIMLRTIVIRCSGYIHTHPYKHKRMHKHTRTLTHRFRSCWWTQRQSGSTYSTSLGWARTRGTPMAE